MYRVVELHYRPCYIKGDLSSEIVTEGNELFKTRTKAKEFVESKLRRLKNVDRNYKKGDATSYCIGFTGYEWVEENTGEKRSEQYQYRLTKVRL